MPLSPALCALRNAITAAEPGAYTDAAGAAMREAHEAGYVESTHSLLDGLRVRVFVLTDTGRVRLQMLRRESEEAP